MTKEEWRPIEGYIGIYEVSSTGRVRSLDRVVTVVRGDSTFQSKIKGRVLRPKLTRLGYHEHGLSNGKKDDMSHFRVNRLVAQTFIPNPNDLPQVHHIDHNKLNNNVENLKWVTAKENIQAEINSGHKWGNFKIGVAHHNAKYTDEQIAQMFKLYKEGYKKSEIAETIGCSRSYVTNVINDRKRNFSKTL
jgi:hypothetical protein